jgi:hypothetical protein
MRPGALEDNFLVRFVDFVNQEPIRFDMAFAAASIITNQGAIMILASTSLE